METATPFQEVIDIIKKEGGEICKLCYQCGTCTGTCPWNTVRSFLIRKIMHQAQLGLPDFENEDMWLCATCKACVDRCPRGVEIIDVWQAIRRTIIEFGVGGIPNSLRITATNISSIGNPQGEDREKRIAWAKDLGVKVYSKDTDVLYYPCCYNAYDPKLVRINKAMVAILKAANVDFGILGPEQSCCGESMRKAGYENLFQNLAQSNIGALRQAGVTKIVTTSPHCFHTIKNEYPQLGGNFEVIHFSQYLAKLVKEGKLNFKKELNKKVTYHDSCYLGRHNNIYDEPRNILQSIPGVKLVEMANNRENSLCCGGGGGRIWEDTKKGERFSDIRLEQAIAAGANIVATACPYCTSMLEDSMTTLNKSDVIEVKEISEMVQEVL